MRPEARGTSGGWTGGSSTTALGPNSAPHRSPAPAKRVREEHSGGFSRPGGMTCLPPSRRIVITSVITVLKPGSGISSPPCQLCDRAWHRSRRPGFRPNLKNPRRQAMRRLKVDPRDHRPIGPPCVRRDPQCPGGNRAPPPTSGFCGRPGTSRHDTRNDPGTSPERACPSVPRPPFFWGLQYKRIWPSSLQSHK